MSEVWRKALEQIANCDGGKGYMPELAQKALELQSERASSDAPHMHYSNAHFAPSCGDAAENFACSLDPSKVTCPKCLGRLGRRPQDATNLDVLVVAARRFLGLFLKRGMIDHHGHRRRKTGCEECLALYALADASGVALHDLDGNVDAPPVVSRASDKATPDYPSCTHPSAMPVGEDAVDVICWCSACGALQIGEEWTHPNAPQTDSAPTHAKGDDS